MATQILTEKSPAALPNVGTLPGKTLLGWRLSTLNAADFVLAINSIVGSQGWIGTARCVRDPLAVPDASGFVSTIWTVTLQKANYQTLNCMAGQWVTFDGVTPGVLDDEVVQEKYTVTDYTP